MSETPSSTADTPPVDAPRPVMFHAHDGVAIPRIAGEFVLDPETGRFLESPPKE